MNVILLVNIILAFIGAAYCTGDCGSSCLDQRVPPAVTKENGISSLNKAVLNTLTLTHANNQGVFLIAKVKVNSSCPNLWSIIGRKQRTCTNVTHQQVYFNGKSVGLHESDGKLRLTYKEMSVTEFWNAYDGIRYIHEYDPSDPKYSDIALVNYIANSYFNRLPGYPTHFKDWHYFAIDLAEHFFGLKIYNHSKWIRETAKKVTAGSVVMGGMGLVFLQALPFFGL